MNTLKPFYLGREELGQLLGTHALAGRVGGLEGGGL